MAIRRDTHTLPGSYRGAPPVAGGQGSGAGPSHANMTPAARGRRGNGNGAWSPTVVNLLILIALEIGAYAGLRYLFRTVHGG